MADPCVIEIIVSDETPILELVEVSSQTPQIELIEVGVSNGADPNVVEVVVSSDTPVAEVVEISSQTLQIELIEVGFLGSDGALISDDVLCNAILDDTKNSPITSIVRIADLDGEQTLIQDVIYGDWKGYSNHNLLISYDVQDRMDVVRREFDFEGEHYIYEFQLTWSIDDQVEQKTITQFSVV